jgi:Methylamine utilisation protein MauE
MTTIELACRTALCLVMAIAAAGKLRAPGELVAAMRAMALPASISTPAGAALVAFAELSAVAALVLVPVAGYVIVIGLLVAFTAGLARAIARRTTASCRCFGATAQPIGRAHIVRNVLLLAIAAIGLATRGTAEPQWLAVIPGALVSLAIVAWDEVIYVFVPATGLRTVPRRRGASLSRRRSR